MGFQVDSLQLNRQQKLRNDQGAAAVEFALLLPVLTLIVVGMMTFGLLLNNYLEITHAAREGVRWAALRDSLSEVENKTKAASPGIDWSKATIIRTGVADPVNDDDQGGPVTVTVTYNIVELKGMLGVFEAILPDQIMSSATQRVE